MDRCLESTWVLESCPFLFSSSSLFFILILLILLLLLPVPLPPRKEGRPNTKRNSPNLCDTQEERGKESNVFSPPKETRERERERGRGTRGNLNPDKVERETESLSLLPVRPFLSHISSHIFSFPMS